MRATAKRAGAASHRWMRRVVWSRVDDPRWGVQAGLTLATLGVLVFMIRVIGAGWPQKFAIFYPDSFSFLNAARLTPFHPKFYATERPIGFPTLLFLLGRSTVVTVVVQTALYALAFVGASAVMWRTLRSPVARVVGASLLLLIGLQPRFALWTTHILSESLGITTAVVSVIAWWLFARTPDVRHVRWASLATIAWIVTRDSNVPPWVALGVPAMLISSWAWRSATPDLRRALRRWGAITLVVCIVVGLGQASYGRNRFATMNNVGLRVLPDAELTSWFEDQGMPLDEALERRRGFSSFDNGWDMLNSPELVEFRDWADGPGQRWMLISYLRFAPHWIDALSDDLDVLLASDQSAYDTFGVAERLPGPAPWQLGGPTTPDGLLLWTAAAALGAIACALRNRRTVAVVLLIALASTFVDLYLAYVGDSVEVQRHMVGPLARMAVVMTLCIAAGIDAVAEMVRSRRVLVEPAAGADPDDDVFEAADDDVFVGVEDER